MPRFKDKQAYQVLISPSILLNLIRKGFGSIKVLYESFIVRASMP